LTVFENRLLRSIFGPKRDEVGEEWRNYKMMSLMISIPHSILFEKNEMGGECYTMGGGKAYTGFRWENVRKRDHLEDPGVDGKMIIRWVFRKWDVRAWTGSIWLRIGRGGGDL